jgi:hypothetical protein
MRSACLRLLAIGLILSLQSFGAHSEGGCPPGQYPQTGQGWQTCVPIPGASQTQSTQRNPAWIARWGAISVDTHKGVIGSVDDVLGREDAEKQAVDLCKSKGGATCILGVSYKNGCGSMSVGNGGLGFGSGATKNAAETDSMIQCAGTQGDAQCHPYYTGCSTPLAQ